MAKTRLVYGWQTDVSGRAGNVTTPAAKLDWFAVGLTSVTYVSIMTLLMSSVGGSLYAESLPFIIIGAWSIGRIAYFAGVGRSALLEIVFWVFAYVWLSLAPLLQIATRSKPLPLDIRFADYANAGWVVIIGLIGYEFGRAVYPRAARARPNRAVARVTRLRLVGCLSLLCCIVAIGLAGGPSSFLGSRESLNDALYVEGASDNSSGAIVSALAISPIFFSMLAYLTLLKSHRNQIQRLDRWLMCVLLFANLLVNNPIAQSRFWFATVWLSFATVYFWNKKGLFRYFPTILVLLVILVFPFADVYRYANPQEQVLQFSSPAQQLAAKGDFDSLEQIAWGVKYVNSFGQLDGQQIAGAALFWIPRSIWEDKPRDTGIVLAQAARLENTSVSAPLWVEGYVDGGYVGAAALLFVIGILHRRFSVYFSVTGPLSSPVALLPVYQLVVLRGSLIQSMAGSAVLVVGYYLVTVRARDRVSE